MNEEEKKFIKSAYHFLENPSFITKVTDYLGKPVEMAKIAEGKIWTLQLHHTEFENIKKDLTIIHHMRDGELIKMRVLADVQPHEEANLVKANLEDAYLCLLNQNE